MAKSKAKEKVGAVKTTLRKRMLDGKEVKPVKYDGNAVGRGAFLAGMVEGRLVCNEHNVPLKFDKIGKME